MNCPNCGTYCPNNIETCSHCGFKLNNPNWVIISNVCPPNDMIIESILKSANIPVRLQRRGIIGFPVAIGPLAEVRILVPNNYEEEAKNIIDEFSQGDQMEET
ncbi:MAG: hypothetical protein GX333_09685 [Syntrophomonadaceae bacterium]|nr:hypothetical protein [Syntrophomonadaceae bacterium]